MVYFVGHFNIEDIYYPSYSRLGTAGGACLYAAMGARIWTDQVGVISRIGDDYPAAYLKTLKSMGVALHLRHMPGPTMASRTEYAAGQDRVFTMKNPPKRLDELTPDSDDVQAAQIPTGSFVHLSAMSLEKLERIVDHLCEKNVSSALIPATLLSGKTGSGCGQSSKKPIFFCPAGRKSMPAPPDTSR